MVRKSSRSSSYQRLADDLAQQITTGDLAPGSPLPSERELSDRYKVSATTVRTAIRLLKEAGLVVSHQGRGSFVRLPREKIRRDARDRYNWEKKRAALTEQDRAQWVLQRDAAVDPSQIDFSAEFERLPASAELAARFGIVAGTPMLHRMYRTGGPDEHGAYILSDSWLRVDLIESNPALLDPANEPWPGGTIHQLRTVGIEVARIIDEVTGRPPSPDEARALQLHDVGTAVLEIRKTSIDTTGRVVEIATAVLAGDRTELVYTTDLDPW
ncbi:MAG TPA: GntR family transcriptional regulator [Acidimicrobiales bacterium]|nr:GntR family transcriptional regulator [Acidimicrobiales bacterium]